MQRIEENLEEGNGEVKIGLEKSRARLLKLLEKRPESAGLKRALETHDINIEKVRLRLTKRERVEEDESETEEEETSDEESEEVEDEESDLAGNSERGRSGVEE